MVFQALVARLARRLFGTSSRHCCPLLAVAAASGFLLGTAAQTPSSYDLRTCNCVTPVKYQGTYGNCWSYGALSGVESSMLTEGLATDPNSPAVDFSETHLSQFYDGAAVAQPINGGNRMDSLSYFASGRGPVLESQYAYPGYSGALYSNYDYAPQCWVTSQQWIDPDNSYHPATMQDIKNAVMAQGAVETEMYWDGGSSFNSTTDTYCYSGSQATTNHSVSIVGWNNSLVTQGGTGAWLVKNSWGTSWGNNGYFWLSYNDTSAVQDATSYKTAAANTYSAVLQNETGAPMGWYNVKYGAEKFTAQSLSALKGIGFAASNYGVQYQLSVYSSWSNGAPAGLLETQSGSETWPGYYVVNLGTPIHLAANSGFVIELHVSETGGSGDDLGVDMSSGNPSGVDYYSFDGGSWTDMSTLGGENVLFLKALVSNVLPGDANQDGKVDVNDLTIVLSNFGRTGMTWSQGDFIGDGKVDINDLTILLTNFGQTAGASASVGNVPEPSAAALMVAGAACLLASARRRRSLTRGS